MCLRETLTTCLCHPHDLTHWGLRIEFSIWLTANDQLDSIRMAKYTALPSYLIYLYRQKGSNQLHDMKLTRECSQLCWNKVCFHQNMLHTILKWVFQVLILHFACLVMEKYRILKWRNDLNAKVIDRNANVVERPWVDRLTPPQWGLI